METSCQILLFAFPRKKARPFQFLRPHRRLAPIPFYPIKSCGLLFCRNLTQDHQNYFMVILQHLLYGWADELFIGQHRIFFTIS